MNLLYITCFLDLSGVTKINFDILSGISGRFNIHICETVDDAGLACKMQSHFKARFGKIFQLWQIPVADRYRFFISYLRNNAIDIIYNTHSLWLYEHASRLKRDLPRVRIVDSLHVLEPYCFRGGYPDISANRFIHPFIDKSIVISEHLLAHIRHYYRIDAAKFVVIRNGIDSGKFRKDPNLTDIFKYEIGAPQNVPLIGFIGRFTRQKRPDVFLEVASHILKHYGQTYFFLVGCGDLVSKLKDIANKLRISSWVRFVPPRDDIHFILNSTDMLLVTSSYEGAPLTVLEALATGVPVVSYDVGAIKEYIGKDWLVTPGRGEVERLAETAMMCFRTKAVQQFDRERFGIDKLVARYADVFESCQ